VLAFFGNLAPSELLVLAVIAVLVFGKRLPEVAGRGYTQVRRWRHSLDQLRRETGIDRELRNIEREVDDVARNVRITEDLERVRHAEERRDRVEPDSSEPGSSEPDSSDPNSRETGSSDVDAREPEGVVEREPGEATEPKP